MSKNDSQQTPLMAQYFRIKKANPDTVLLFRVGDFFETFEEDAKTEGRLPCSCL
jgi:DNA mismatch repair protein MutS